jgi:hypothetical protein
MAQIGSLVVDLVLKSAQFNSDLAKTSKAVAANTSVMRKSFDSVRASVSGLTVGFGSFLSARTFRALSRITQDSIKLAATWDGPLKSSAQNFLKQAEDFSNAFQFGVAQGFLEALNGQLGNSEASLRAINEIGARVGTVLGQGFAFASQNLGPLADGLGKVVDFLEYIATHTPGQAVDDLLGKQSMQPLDFGDMNEQLGIGATAFDVYKSSIAGANKELANTSKQINVVFPDIEKLQQQMFETSLKTTQSWLGVADTVGQALGTLFKENKAVAIGQAVINTAQAITEALKLPFPINWAQVAAVSALGAAQIATIASAQPGTSKKPSKGSGKGSSGGGAAKASAPAAGGSASQRSMNVVINGSNFSRDQVRMLVAQMNEMAGDGLMIRTG